MVWCAAGSCRAGGCRCDGQRLCEYTRALWAVGSICPPTIDVLRGGMDGGRREEGAEVGAAAVQQRGSEGCEGAIGFKIAGGRCVRGVCKGRGGAGWKQGSRGQWRGGAVCGGRQRGVGCEPHHDASVRSACLLASSFSLSFSPIFPRPSFPHSLDCY